MRIHKPRGYRERWHVWILLLLASLLLGAVPVFLGLYPAQSKTIGVGNNVMQVFSSCSDAQTKYPQTNCITVNYAGTQPLTIARCSSVTVPLELDVIGGLNAQPSLAVRLVGQGGDNSTGVVLANGTRFSFNQFMKYGSGVVTVQVGQVAHVTLTISIPCGFPPELFGKQLQFDVSSHVVGLPDNFLASGVFEVPSSVMVVVS